MQMLKLFVVINSCHDLFGSNGFTEEVPRTAALNEGWMAGFNL